MPRLTRFASVTLLATLVGAGCGSDFDTTRETPPRKSLGRELYTLVCDRVGAQALREDVSGLSFHDVCHPDAKGKYASKVALTELPPIEGPAEDTKGKGVSVATQKANRARRVARVEALSRRREDLITAFDAALPDIDVVLKQVDGRTVAAGCDVPATAKEKKDRFLSQLAETFSRFIDMYNDGTIPSLTRAIGKTLQTVQGDQEVQAALARLEARQGYRPTAIALGLARPVLAYPRLFSMVNTLLTFVSDDSDPYRPKKTGPIPGKANAEFRELLDVMHGELRVPDPEAPPALTVSPDPLLPVPVLSRPRSKLEIAREVLLAEADVFGTPSSTPRYIVRRDPRGFASVAFVDGKLAGPFVDDGTGLPKLDELGLFVTAGTEKVPTPFFALGASDGQRDAVGRALWQGGPLYGYVDLSRSYVSAALRDVKPLIDPQADDDHQTFLNVMAALPILMGGREETPSATRTYPPLPGTKADVKLSYRRFHAEDAPVVDLVHALGQTMNDPAVQDMLVLVQKLLREQPQKVARLIGIGFQLKQIADAHPEARLPAASTLWDDLLETFGKVAHEPGILEDLLKAFGDEHTLKLNKTFAAYMKYRDVLTYQKDPAAKEDEAKLNGPAFNTTTKSIAPLGTPVDRSKPDTGDNRSALQKFIHLLHDANGLAACTKQGAVAHLDIVWPKGSGIHIKLNYPTDVLVKTVCAALASDIPPDPMPACGILGFDNVATLLLDVVLGRAKFDIKDKCLATLVGTDWLTGLVGGPDAFLEEISGIKGFNLNPSIPGIARFVHFDTPYDIKEWGAPYKGDDYYPKTRDFFKDILDPIPTMNCPETPYTAPDGTIYKLRKCASVKDTIRGRHANALFPLEQFDFVTNIQPLAAVFADHKQPLLFVELFDRAHLHWGSPSQSKEECDPGAPKSSARWCTQDGAVTYEPLLAEILETDLFATLYDFVKLLQKTTIPHCDAYDSSTLACKKVSQRGGVEVLAEATRVMIDPARSKGMKDRKGNTYATRNDGGKVPQTTPAYLLIDALKGFDAAFEKNLASDPDGEATRARWKLARSQIVDQFFAIDGSGDQASFRNQAVQELLPRVIDVLLAQVRANCLPGTASCDWSQEKLAANMADTIDGPTFAAVMGFFEAVRKDPGAKAEVQQLANYLLDSATNDASDTTLSATADLMQILGDDANLTPLYRVVASALARPTVDARGNVTERPLLDSLLSLLTRVFARGYDPKGAQRCTSERDPQETLGVVLSRLVTPMEKTNTAPIEIIFSVIADVNREDPSQTTKLTGKDYANISKEAADFFLNPGTGMEQVYDLIREATKQ